MTGVIILVLHLILTGFIFFLNDWLNVIPGMTYVHLLIVACLFELVKNNCPYLR